MFPLSPHLWFELASFVASVFYFYKIKNTYLRWLPYYLLFILVVEFLGRYLAKVLLVSNIWLYNISIPIEYLYFAYIFFATYNNRIFKKIAFIFLVSFPFFIALILILITGIDTFNTSALKLGSFFMLLFCGFYFAELLTSNLIINPLKAIMFWISSGLLLFNAGEFVYNIFSDSMVKHWNDFGIQLFMKINNTLIYIFYSSITIGLIVGKWASKEKI